MEVGVFPKGPWHRSCKQHISCQLNIAHVLSCEEKSVALLVTQMQQGFGVHLLHNIQSGSQVEQMD